MITPTLQLHPQHHKHLCQLELADSYEGGEPFQPDILVGSDQYWNLITGETIRERGGLVAVHTHLGWVLSGPVTLPAGTATSVNCVVHVLKVDADSGDTSGLDNQLRTFWELESLGIAENESSVQDSFKDSISLCNGRYQVTLPWKEVHPTLSSNRPQCVKRLQGLLHRLKQHPSVLSEYDALIKDQLQRGVIEKVPDETTTQSTKVYYMPHHAVTRQDKKTTKLRIVYDASAKADGTSLNDCLYAGPKYDQNIFSIILRFRLHRTALVADIEKAFLQISVVERDRDALRFLWVNDVNKPEPDIVPLRFTRMPFGVTSSH